MGLEFGGWLGVVLHRVVLLLYGSQQQAKALHVCVTGTERQNSSSFLGTCCLKYPPRLTADPAPDEPRSRIWPTCSGDEVTGHSQSHGLSYLGGVWSPSMSMSDPQRLASLIPGSRSCYRWCSVYCLHPLLSWETSRFIQCIPELGGQGDNF